MMGRDIAREPGTRGVIDAHTPLGRMACVEEVAGAACFLCAPDASYINGVDLVVDSGLTLMCLI